MTKIVQIQWLLRKVEKRLGRPVKSPIDFDYLSLRIGETIPERLSTTTLKRIWGYIHTEHAPRYSTLSTLARYVGYEDWDDFLAKTTEEYDESEFVLCNELNPDSLTIGDRIELCWQPDRRCVIIYNGNYSFTVQESYGCKIVAGDTFRAQNFIVGHPLYLNELRHGAEQPKSYVAGSHNGLTTITLLK